MKSTWREVLCRLVLNAFFVCVLIGCVSSSAMQPVREISITTVDLPARETIWYQMRRNFKWPSYASHAEVKKQIRWYQRRPHHFQKVLKAATPYIQHTYEQTQKHGLPIELALLPFVESNYNPFAYSKAGALGLWQLMPGTASGLGLAIDWWYDGRRDLVASTEAALNHFSYLKRFFHGNWLHALAAYDSGEGTIQRAIRRNKKSGRAHDFWHLKLPKETRQYVPRLLALVEIIKHPKRYRLTLPSVSKHPYLGTVKISSQIDLLALAKLAGLSGDDLYALNSGFRRRIIPPKGSYNLVLPRNRVEHFKLNLANLPKEKQTIWQYHKVKSGHSLGTIAKQHKTTVAALKKANGLRHNKIKTNQRLLIPYGIKTLSSLNTKKRREIAADRLPGPKQTVYHARKGDSLKRVAKRFRVKLAEIAYWNKLSLRHKLKKGEQLVFWRKNKYFKYKVRAGDSLSTIAQRYHISVKQIKLANRLKSTTIRSGSVLSIPH